MKRRSFPNLLAASCLCSVMFGGAFSGRAPAAFHQMVAFPRAQAVLQVTAELELVGHVDGNINSVVIQGTYAYVLDRSSSTSCFRIIDISDPANPIEVGHFNLTTCYSLDVFGSYVYATTLTIIHYQLHIIDISNLNKPVEVGSYVTVGSGWGPISISFPYAYLGTWYHDPHGFFANFLVLDVSDPTQPVLVATRFTKVIRQILTRGPYVFVASVDSIYFSEPHGLDIYNTSDPENPVLIAAGAPSNAEDETLLGDYLVVSGSDYRNQAIDGLFIENISDLNHPEIVTALPEYFGVLSSSGENIFVGTDQRLAVLNISRPRYPTEIGAFELPSPIVAITTDGEFVLVADGDAGLFILKLSGRISGQITDVNRIPFPGVTLESSVGITSTVDASGFFTFTQIPAGVVTITPTLAGYVFQPTNRTIQVPSNQEYTGEFTILPAPVDFILNPGVAINLTLLDTQGLTTTLTFPAQAITQTVTMRLTPFRGENHGDWAFAGHAFALSAISESFPANLRFGAPANLVIHYSEQDLRLVTDETRLALWTWQDNRWREVGELCGSSTTHDSVANTLSVPVCQAGVFELVGPSKPIWLPQMLSLP